MVRLYCWNPTAPETVLAQGIMPDVGHVSLEVVAPDGKSLAYASFWPEIESVIGRLTSLLKPRPTRHPSDYLEEADPNGSYMQRPADVILESDTFEEERIISGWDAIHNGNYDLFTWNCSNVCKYLLIRAISPENFECIKDAAVCTPEDIINVHSDRTATEVFAYLATSKFIDCRPLDIHRLFEAYVNLRTVEAPA